MRYAHPTELTKEVVPVLQLPVKTVTLDPLAAGEPSRGALVRLDSGSYVVVTYGEITHDAPKVVRELPLEIDVPGAAIEWNRFDVQPPALAGAATKFKKGT